MVVPKRQGPDAVDVAVQYHSGVDMEGPAHACLAQRFPNSANLLGQQTAVWVGQSDCKKIAMAGNPVGMVVAHAGSLLGRQRLVSE